MSFDSRRLSIVMTENQAKKLYQLLPWGVKNKLFCAIIDDLIPQLEKHGEKIIMAILSHDLKLKHYAKSLYEVDNGNSTKP